MSDTTTTSREIRDDLISTLNLELIGPNNDHICCNELLGESPFKWYLTGFLVPSDAPEDVRLDPESSDDLGESTIPSEPGASEDNDQTNDAASAKSFLPSSMGLSVILPAEAETLKVITRWGDYHSETEEREAVDDLGEEEHGYSTEKKKKIKGFRRESREETVVVDLTGLVNDESKDYVIPNSGKGGLRVTVISRVIARASELGMPAGAKAVSVFLVNYRESTNHVYASCAFQAELELLTAKPFLNQPDLRGLNQERVLNWDDRLADLQYRNITDYAIGHGISTKFTELSSGECTSVKTVWLPQHEVELVSPAQISNVEFSMSAIANFSSQDELKAELTPLVDQYREWIEKQRADISHLSKSRQDTANEALANAAASADRIQSGIETLCANSVAFQAFKIVNKTMGRSATQRLKIADPAWRPFQLAFILQNIEGLTNRDSDQREIVDLLFFPTGGGKTEAYLGLAAYIMVLRRLTNPGISYAGVSVLMRYTLRLLTLDQLGRAAGLMCALELEREQNEALGAWPFEIGLWVGSAATPNRMGGRGYKGPGAEYTAYRKVSQFLSNSDNNPSPIPLENCPWCGEKFDRNSFKLKPNINTPENLEIRCSDRSCEFSRKRALPILSVDETIYRRLPAFLIATVDKFASLPWEGKAGAILGHVSRHDSKGFYGAAEPKADGQALDKPLLGPDLIIQDELHLISGPLGTIAGVYETAIEHLSSRLENERIIKPKIIASTATVKKAGDQIQSLFGRDLTAIFPSQGPNIKDSFFAITKKIEQSNGRMYLGVAAQGRSLKVILMRVSLAMLCASKKLYEDNGGKDNDKNPVDPYMTLLGYFNSLRELGGSRRIIEDEVVSRATRYSKHKRLDPKINYFADRNVAYEPEELTSRVSTDKVAKTKRLLEREFYEDPKQGRPVDVALATNMISVGLDISRLGLMMVLGQPKGTAEYIQATSRVGRQEHKPGLIINLLNNHKPRDRSHYEHFSLYHKTFYRAVESSSVTPFSPRAMDRALAAALIAVCRHSKIELTPALGAGRIVEVRQELNSVAELFAERARTNKGTDDHEQYDKVLANCKSLLDVWLKIQQRQMEIGLGLQYQQEVRTGANAARLLHYFLEQDLPEPVESYKLFRANRSMRDVEANVNLQIKKLNEPLS